MLTIEAKELYEFPPKALRDDYKFTIDVADVTKTFDEIKPLYTIPSVEQELIYKDNKGNSQKLREDFYIPLAVIQTHLEGKDLVDIIDDNYCEKLYLKMKKRA